MPVLWKDHQTDPMHFLLRLDISSLWGHERKRLEQSIDQQKRMTGRKQTVSGSLHQERRSIFFGTMAARIGTGDTPDYYAARRKYNPDIIASLGDDMQALANPRSKEINAAYEEAELSKGFQW